MPQLPLARGSREETPAPGAFLDCHERKGVRGEEKQPRNIVAKRILLKGK